MMEAFTVSGRKWSLYPSMKYQEDYNGSLRLILTLHGPAEYYWYDLLSWISNKKSPNLCIDAGGRNFGVLESVYVKVSEILDFVRTS